MIVFPALPVRNPCVSIAYHKVILSAEECRHVIETAKATNWEAGAVGEPGASPEQRSRHRQRLPVDANGFPLNRIVAEACQANSEGWKFELSGLVADDLPWIVRYDADARGHNDWHIDLGQATNASRKLAFTIQLSDPASYDGGDLEFHNIESDSVAIRQIGTMNLFPAYWLYRVGPVTSGQRFAIVGWLHGPSFR